MASHVAQLKSMFPAIDEESIRSVLTHCRNDGTAINTVLRYMLIMCRLNAGSYLRNDTFIY